MLRNRNRNRDMINGGFPYNDPPMQSSPPVSKLEPENERMLDLSEMVGQLGAQNDMLNEDNRRLEQDNQKLEEHNKTLIRRNAELEREDAEKQSIVNTAEEIVKQVVANVKDRKK
jgi:plasmid replication initiation protein